MFYIPQILGQKGPLSVVWLAAHYDKTVSKKQIMDTDIKAIIDLILSAQVKLSLRVTSDLMVGICQIQKRKTIYLMGEFDRFVHSMEANFKQSTKVSKLDLPNIIPMIDINIPEILEYVDLNIPQNLSPELAVNRRSITLNEIPELTADELREEQEIYQQIYDLGDNNQNQSVTIDDIFGEFLPLPPQNDQEDYDEPMLPPDPMGESPSPSPPLPSPPQLAADQNVAEVQYTNIISAAQITNQTIKSSDRSAEISARERKRSRTRDINNNNFVESNFLDDFILPPFEVSNEVSAVSRKGPLGLRSNKRRRKPTLVIDHIIKIPDYQMRNAIIKRGPNYHVPDLAIPCFCSKLFDNNTLSLFQNPFRQLPKVLSRHFKIASGNVPIVNSPVQATHIESCDGSFSDILSQANIPLSPLPPRSLNDDQDIFDDQLPMPMDDDFDDQPPQPTTTELDSLPVGRDQNENVIEDNRRISAVNDFSVTDILNRSLVDEIFNATLNERLDEQSVLIFDDLLADQQQQNKNRPTVAHLFSNLLELSNQQLIRLEQDQSYRFFNDIIITRGDFNDSPTSIQI